MVLLRRLKKHMPDIILILGDRFEVFSCATAAMTMNIPIAHISGGEVTEGAIDDQIRHAISKMAHIHFPGAETYANNLLNLGEESWRIFNVGDPGIEYILKHKPMEKAALEESLGMNISENTVLVTYHPVTMELENNDMYIQELFEALDKMCVDVIFTYPNMDAGGENIIKAINEYIQKNSSSKAFKSLGSERYVSLLHYVKAMIGNSSSGIVEAPALCLPVINIGNRQTGRLKADNIIDVQCVAEEIIAAWEIIMNDDNYAKTLANTKSLYGR